MLCEIVIEISHHTRIDYHLLYIIEFVISDATTIQNGALRLIIRRFWRIFFDVCRCLNKEITNLELELTLFRVGVRLGEHNINTDADCDVIKGICSPPVQDFYVEGAMTHPQYNPSSFQNDIGLIRLASPANFSFGNNRSALLSYLSIAQIFFREHSTYMFADWGECRY